MEGGDVVWWSGAVSWILILLPALRSPVMAFALLAWGGLGRDRGQAVVAALAMVVADPVGAFAWLRALAGEAVIGLFRRCQITKNGSGGGDQPEQLAELGEGVQGQPPPPSRPWYLRAFLGAVDGIMAGDPVA